MQTLVSQFITALSAHITYEYRFSTVISFKSTQRFVFLIDRSEMQGCVLTNFILFFLKVDLLSICTFYICLPKSLNES